ncbi:MAG TPA: hypothetical protein DEB24_00850 [Coriobacteriia bacterium]|nr:hypothetical protein [Coriobacteriia bacterium]
MTENQVVSGWYADPAGVPGKLRYWDGSAWTEYYQQTGVSPHQQPAMYPGGQPAPQQQPMPYQNQQAAQYPHAQIQTPMYPGQEPGAYPEQPVMPQQSPYQMHPAQTPMQAPMYGQPVQAQPIYTVTQEPEKTGREGLAIASLVLGIVGMLGCCVLSLNVFVGAIFCLVLSVPALIFGLVGLKSARKGCAVAGISLGGLLILVGLFYLILFFLVIAGNTGMYSGSGGYIY